MNLSRSLAVAIPGALLAVALFETAPAPAGPDAPAPEFTQHPLLAIGDAPRGIRQVHPDLARIAGWISGVGAAVALFDHDGDGLANDYCLVDPRFDSVTVAPAPTTGDRFAPFALVEPLAAAGPVAPMGCLPGDFDEDGTQDLLVYYWGRAPGLHLAADGFAERPLLDRHEVWHTNAAAQIDADGDGRMDLIFGNYFPETAEILGTAGAPRMQLSMSNARNAGRNRLFLSRGGGAFDDASDALSAAPEGWTLGIGGADLSGDDLPEIYIANDFGPDRLLHNRSRPGAPAFALVEARRGLFDPRSRVLGRDSFKGMGVDFGDVDGDGALDIFVSSIAEDYALMESHLLFRATGDPGAFEDGVAPFEEISGALGVARSAWSWDARFADFDNDGVPEILQATGFLKGDVDRWAELHETAMGNDQLLPLPAMWHGFGPGDDLSGDRRDALFARGPDGRYRDVSAAAGFQPGTISRGIALGDVDGDGDLDALIARQWQPSVLLLNRTTGGPGLTVAPRVRSITGADRPAWGAQLVLRAADGTGPKIAAIVPAGEGHSGKSAPEAHFGLGAWPEGAPLELELRWRDAEGAHRVVRPVAAGRFAPLLTAAVAGAPARLAALPGEDP